MGGAGTGERQKGEAEEDANDEKKEEEGKEEGMGLEMLE